MTLLRRLAVAKGIAVMDRTPVRMSLRPLAAILGLLLTLASASSASAVGTPEQRRACTPDVYRLCAGEIPNVRAIAACLRRQKASLSEACRAVFEQ
jgi:hypothetical protein